VASTPCTRAIPGGVCEGVVNLGVRPTFGRRRRPAADAELHLLDFRGNLYGRDIEVFFVARLRDERAFSSPKPWPSRSDATPSRPAVA